MKRYFQHSALLTLSIIIGILKPTYGFSECPSSGVTDPSIPGVSDCPSWIAYLKSTGQNLEAWCGNSANYKKCCLTCQNLGTRGDCTDVADSADCRIKQSQGLCTAQSDAGITVRIYCQKTCNICPATFSGLDLSCNTKICNSGTCQAANYFNVASVKCSCPTGTAGTYCQRQNSCSLSPCLNGGVCSSVNDEDILYTCTCLSGFSGKNCQTGCLPVSGCLTFVCQNGGQCRLNSANQPECVCLNGFLGVNCEILPCQNPCFNNPCMNGGTCQNSGTTYTCFCTQGFTGANCQGITNSQACGYNQCKNGASCYETSQTTYGCACPGGFYGTFCESTAIGPINTNSCQNNPCLNGGTCQTVGISGYICLCPAGTSGTNCASTGTVTSRPCSSNQCKNGATCYDTSFTQYGCACVIGFFGTYCDQQQTDLGGCSTNPCFNGGTCQSLGNSGSYICLCASGYTGLTCQGLAGSACNSNQCRNGATCYASSATTYSCACLINFYGTYCENSKQLCQTNSCKNGATCKDIGNSDFICICPVGFSGLYCESSSTVRPNNLVTVSVVTRSVSDKCASNLCKNGATCYETLVGEYGCACLGGFYGRYCENTLTASPVSSCINNPCLNGSTCQSINSTSFKCLCPTGMTGKNCETNMNLCKAGYCLNGGTCYIISMNQTACSCSAGFEGVNCQTAVVDTVKTTNLDLCNPNPCLNGGVCQANNSIGSASCNCLPGYFGNRCDQTNICFSEPCQNGGSCIPNGITGYTCTCTSLFAGDNCQSASCKSTPCQNGGLCLITGNLPYCKCLPGFTGKSCEFPSTCDTMKCKNGGTCISDNNNHVECRCPKSFYGQYCENQITEEVCKIGDRNKIDCQIWEFYGFCSFAYTYNAVPVPIYCPISCKLCTDANVCADTQTNCGIWKTLGLCDNVNQIDVNACRKSCGYCS